MQSDEKNINQLINIYVREGERVDDLQISGLRLIQNPNQFCFGVDATLLSYYASLSIKPGAEVLDLCSGNGIIPILLTAKCGAARIVGLEIQKDVAEMAERSVRLNSLEDKVDILCGDLKDGTEIFKRSSFDNITCNPPYKERGSGQINETDSTAIARHEILCDLEDIISVSAALLRPGGKLTMIHRPDRLIDLCCLMRKYKLEPKKLRVVHPSYNKTATMILVEAARGGRPKLFLDPPLYIYDEKGNYTDEIDKIYAKEV